MQVVAPGIAVCLFILNMLWFRKICQGAVKMILGSAKQA